MIVKIISVQLLALLLITSGVILLITRVWIYDSIISSIFTISPSGVMFEVWRKPPVEISTSFYLFNWTNPEDIYNHTIKPKLEQVGPYIFKINTEKVNLTWNSNHTLTYRMHQLYFFDEENSNGSLSDVITTLNTVTLSAAHKLRYDGYFTKKAFSFSLSLLSPTLHIEKTAGELLFDGYQDPYVDIYNTLPFLAEEDSPSIDKAGYLYRRNNSYTIDGTYSVATGVNGTTGELVEWNYRRNIRQHNETCANLGGTIGDFYPPRRTKDFATMFIADLCRNLKLDFEDEVSVKGINGYKYTAQHSVFDNGTKVPENKCYCRGECVPYGAMNLTSCAHGAPTFISLPHFYGADPSYLDKVDGLKPVKSKHEMFVTLEPRMGFCIDLALRLQLNFLLHPVEYITMYDDVPTIFFPLLWSEQRVSIPAEHAIFIKILIRLPTIILPVFGSILIMTGIILIIYTRYKFKRKPVKTLVNEELKSKKGLLECEEMNVIDKNYSPNKKEKAILYKE